MRTILTLKDKLLEAWQQMDWEKIAQLEQTNEFKVQYKRFVPERQRPIQSEQVYLHESGIETIEQELLGYRNP